MDHPFRRRQLTKSSESASSNLYPDFDSALHECGAGYESHDVAAVVVAKTRSLLGCGSLGMPPSGVLLAASGLIGRGDRLRVVDLGGAAGAHYLMIRRIVPDTVALDWTVVETGAMVQAARSLELPPEVKFVTSLEAALEASQPISLVLASGVLMYLPDPLGALSLICAAQPQTIVVSRTGLSQDDELRIIVQSSKLSDNGIGPLPAGFQDSIVKYPNTFASIKLFEEILNRNHRIIVRGQEENQAWMAGSTPIGQYGYLAVRKT